MTIAKSSSQTNRRLSSGPEMAEWPKREIPIPNARPEAKLRQPQTRRLLGVLSNQICCSCLEPPRSGTIQSFAEILLAIFPKHLEGLAFAVAFPDYHPERPHRDVCRQAFRPSDYLWRITAINESAKLRELKCGSLLHKPILPINIEPPANNHSKEDVGPNSPYVADTSKTGRYREMTRPRTEATYSSSAATTIAFSG
jgi:hypothetical protein